MVFELPAFVFLLLEPPRWSLSSQSVIGEDYNIGSFVTLALCSDIDTTFLPPRPSIRLSVYAILKPFRSVSRRKLTEGITSNSCCSALALALAWSCTFPTVVLRGIIDGNSCEKDLAKQIAVNCRSGDDWSECKIDEVACTENRAVEKREEKSQTSRHRGQEATLE